MHALAKHLESQGRNGDSVLVHMTPGEVGGLQTLAQAAGGSLTINPHTGLPEAGWLSSLLPIVAGIAGTFVGIPPMVTAAAVGAITGIAKHDLGAGLMAGLGAYGGAGLGSALSGMGAAAALPAAATTALPAAATTALPAAATTAAGAAGAGTAASVGANAAAGLGAFGNAGLTAANGATVAALGSAPAVAASQAAALAPTGLAGLGTTFATNAANAAKGLGQLGTTEGWSALGNGLSMAQIGGLGAGALGAMEPSAPKATPEEPDKYPYKGPYMPAPRKVRYPTNRDPNDSSEFQYFDTVNPVPNTVPFQPTVTPTGMAAGGVSLKDGSFVVDARTVSELGNGSSGAGQDLLAKFGGKSIKGPGDGVSDSIHANIGGRQEARVARDEVKFDPKAVQRLGKGDPRKGSDRLYALMAKAHDARQSAKRGQDTGLKGLLGVR